MKQVVWYLPSGSGGMAALHKANGIRSALREWVDRHDTSININQATTLYTKNGLRYLALQLSDDLATIFALTWHNDVSKLRYEYIDDYIPPIHAG